MAEVVAMGGDGGGVSVCECKAWACVCMSGRERNEGGKRNGGGGAAAAVLQECNKPGMMMMCMWCRMHKNAINK